MYRSVISHDTEEWSKLWRKTDVFLKNDMKSLVKFNTRCAISENLHFDGLLFLKVYNVWDKKNMQRSSIMNCGFLCRNSQILWISTQEVESSVR